MFIKILNLFIYLYNVYNLCTISKDFWNINITSRKKRSERYIMSKFKYLNFAVLTKEWKNKNKKIPRRDCLILLKWNFIYIIFLRRSLLKIWFFYLNSKWFQRILTKIKLFKLNIFFFYNIFLIFLNFED